MKRIVCVICVLLFVCYGTGVSARGRELLPPMTGHTKGGILCLTFDDGPHPQYTDRILEVLDKYQVKATFFPIGQNVRKWQQVTKRVWEAGHEIGNHTYHHPHMKDLSKEELLEEIALCDRAVEEVTGVTPVFFRPPEGAKDSASCQGVDRIPVLWTLDTLDWRCRDSAASIAARILAEAKHGDIILCHDYVFGEFVLPQALEIAIPALQKQGYRFVTIGELARSPMIEPR